MKKGLAKQLAKQNGTTMIYKCEQCEYWYAECQESRKVLQLEHLKCKAIALVFLKPYLVIQAS